MAYRYTVFDTKLGWMAIAASEGGLVRLTLPQPAADKAMVLISDLLPKATANTGSFRDVIARIERYLDGEQVEFPDPLDLSQWTEFQRQVWRLVSTVPYGQTRTYAWVAEQLGRPGSVRAVGQALARNPLPIIIPCHRIVGSSGKLVGFSGDLELKKRLLALEAASQKR